MIMACLPKQSLGKRGDSKLSKRNLLLRKQFQEEHALFQSSLFEIIQDEKRLNFLFSSLGSRDFFFLPIDAPVTLKNVANFFSPKFKKMENVSINLWQYFDVPYQLGHDISIVLSILLQERETCERWKKLNIRLDFQTEILPSIFIPPLAKHFSSLSNFGLSRCKLRESDLALILIELGPKLEKLELVDCNIRELDSEVLCFCARLKELILSENPFGNDGLKEISYSLPLQEHLELLNVSRCALSAPPIKWFESFRKLTKLVLAGNKLTSLNTSNHPNCCSIQTLELFDNPKLSFQGLLETFPNLQSLELSRTKLRNSDLILLLNQFYSTLMFLNISSTQVTHFEADSLEKCIKLQHFIVSFNNLDSKSIETVFLSLGERLKLLACVHTNMQEFDINWLGKCYFLEYLYMDKPKDPKKIEEISREIRFLPKIQNISLFKMESAFRPILYACQTFSFKIRVLFAGLADLPSFGKQAQVKKQLPKEILKLIASRIKSLK